MGETRSYFEVMGHFCPDEVTLVQRLLTPLQGVVKVSVVVASKTIKVIHNTDLISTSHIANALNQAGLEASLRIYDGELRHKIKWPSKYVIFCGLLLGISLLQYVYAPLKFVAVGAVCVRIWPILIRIFAAAKN